MVKKQSKTKSLCKYSWLSLSRTRKGLENLFEIERVWDRERKIDYSLHRRTETSVRDREKFEIECVRGRESRDRDNRERNHSPKDLINTETGSLGSLKQMTEGVSTKRSSTRVSANCFSTCKQINLTHMHKY